MPKGSDSKKSKKESDERATFEGCSTSKMALVEKMIKSIEEKLDAKEIRASLGDFIRLLQLQKELEEEKPREINVRWVEPPEKESASEI